MKPVTELQAKTGPFEIERKFLIRYPDIAWLEDQPGCRRIEIVQTYLIADEGEESRVRRRRTLGCEEYVQTTKRRVSDIRRVEIERVINQEEYERLLLQADPACRPIEKTRYCLQHADQLFEIDVYPFWQDQAIMEVELHGEDNAIHFPPQLHVIREVTGDVRFRNAALAQRKPGK